MIRNLSVVTFVFVAVQQVLCVSLLDAVRRNDTDEVMEICMDPGNYPREIWNETDENGNTALHLAATNKEFGSIFRLNYPMPDLSIRNVQGRTAVDVAVACGHDVAFYILNARGADFTNVDVEGNTLAHHGVTGYKDDGIFSFLIERVPLEAVNSYGERPLVLAAKLGKLGAIRCLLKQGVVVNALDREENTALHWAVRRQHRLCVWELLANGKASLEIKNKEGLTAVMLAQQLEDKEIYKDMIAYEIVSKWCNVFIEIRGSDENQK